MHTVSELDEVRARLADLLGQDEPVPVEVALRALAEPSFEADLIIAREAPGFQRALFTHRATLAYRAEQEATEARPTPTMAGEPESAAGFGTIGLLARAAVAVARWGRGGFATVAPEVLQRREDACLTCPNLVEPEHTLLRLVPAGPVSDQVGSRTGGRSCGLCGCVVSRKMRMPTEFCPDRHPDDARLTRWGEPV